MTNSPFMLPVAPSESNADLAAYAVAAMQPTAQPKDPTMAEAFAERDAACAPVRAAKRAVGYPVSSSSK